MRNNNTFSCFRNFLEIKKIIPKIKDNAVYVILILHKIIYS